MTVVAIAAREAARATVRTTAAYGLIIGAEEWFRTGMGFFSKQPQTKQPMADTQQHSTKQTMFTHEKPEVPIRPSMG